jgi:hypothetical protein
LLDGNTTSGISSALSTLPAFTCCSDIHETSSRFNLPAVAVGVIVIIPRRSL